MGSRLARIDEMVFSDINEYKKQLEKEYGCRTSFPTASVAWWRDLKNEDVKVVKHKNKFLGVR